MECISQLERIQQELRRHPSFLAALGNKNDDFAPCSSSSASPCPSLEKRQEASGGSPAATGTGGEESSTPGTTGMDGSPPPSCVVLRGLSSIDALIAAAGSVDCFVKKLSKKVAQDARWSPTRDEFILIEGKSPSGTDRLLP